MKKTNRLEPFQDEVVVYRSKDEGCWIAHSLKTDQMGVGERIVDALADMIKAVHQVCAAAEKNGTLAYLREAPIEVRAIANRAKALPLEIYEIAHKMVHGNWPGYLHLDFTSCDEGASFIAQVPEAACC